MQTKSPSSLKSKTPKKSFIPFIFGIGFILFGLNLYADLALLENQNNFTINPLYKWVYDLGGKIAVSGLFVLVGLLCFVFTALKIKKEKKKRT